MIGIYKITSPSGKVYVGQSIDIEKRFNRYKKMHCKLQVRLFNSLKKHGSDSHIFEVIECCDVDSLNEREYYWQVFYDVLGSNGLNCMITDPKRKKRVVTEETRNRMRETALKFNSIKNLGDLRNKLGKKHKESTKKKIGNAQRGELNHMYGKVGLEHPNFGRKLPKHQIDRHKEILKEMYTNMPKYEYPTSKIVLDSMTGVYYYSIAEIANSMNICNSYLSKQIKSKKPNRYNKRYIITSN